MSRPVRVLVGRHRRKITTESWLAMLLLSCACPVVGGMGFLLFSGRLSTGAALTVCFGAVVWLAVVGLILRSVLYRHVRTLSNLIEATRIQDYSFKSARTGDGGVLGELYQQIDVLTDSLRTGRESERELLSVLEKVVSQIQVAIIVCDSRDRIRLVNLRASTLLKSTPEELLGLEFAQTPLSEVPLSTESRLLEHRFPGGEGRWHISEQQYRHQGQPSRIIFITDLKQVLSAEETAAWQRLIRVISHEMNNSLTPITSLCQTLIDIHARPDRDSYADDIGHGLGVIAERAKGLKEFISAYAHIARLPEPQKILVTPAQIAKKVGGIIDKESLEIVGGMPDVKIFGDPVHLEQALINLIKNALEANGANPRPVRLRCEVRDDTCEFTVVDDGAGISNPENLFVPFYTTKSSGAGIGLVLCRQIAAKHFGQVTLENRPDGKGAVARLMIPLPPSH